MDASAPRARSGSGSGAAASAAPRWVGAAVVAALLVEAAVVFMRVRARVSAPFWYDEQWRAYHLSLTKGFWREPQHINTAVAAGWVAIERASVLAFGNNEWALRLPEVLVLAAIGWPTWRVARHWVGVTASAIIAAAMVASGPLVFAVAPLLAVDLARGLRSRGRGELLRRVGPAALAGGMALAHLIWFVLPQRTSANINTWNLDFLPRSGRLGWVTAQLGTFVPGVVTSGLRPLPGGVNVALEVLLVGERHRGQRDARPRPAPPPRLGGRDADPGRAGPWPGRAAGRGDRGRHHGREGLVVLHVVLSGPVEHLGAVRSRRTAPSSVTRRSGRR